MDPFEQAISRAVKPPHPGTCKLQFFPDPTVAVRPAHPRQIGLIERPLLAILKSLVDGKARWPLYLWSAIPGNGKTSSSLAMLDHCGLGWTEPVATTTEAHEAICGYVDIVTFPKLLRSLAQRQVLRTDNAVPISESDLWQHLDKRRLVVVDDVNRPADKKVGLGEDLHSVFKRILDVRVNRPLILTGNASPDKLPLVWDDRIADRMACGTTFEMRTESRRF